MENPNSKADPAAAAATEADVQENPTNNAPNAGDGDANRRRRTPFTDLSQIDADLALARTLQEQERAYMMLRMNSVEGSDYGSWEGENYGAVVNDDYDDASEDDFDEGSDDEAEDAFDVNAHAAGIEDDDPNVELDPSAYSSDEAYARALQDVEERDMAARLLALTGINDMVVEEDEDEDEDEDVDEDEDEDEYEDEEEEVHVGNVQDSWEGVDPDELSYEELIALGDVVGTESRGLSAESIASLPSVKYKSQGTQEGSCDSCVICRLDYEDDDTLTILSCKHPYHSECINNWLQINKVCPVCSVEVSTSGKS